jgi:hypothetical protein
MNKSDILINYVNEALREARGKVVDAVNWGDLKCVAATEFYDDIFNIHGFTVIVSEASPDAYKLHKFVYDYLRKKGFGDYVEVITEW